MFTDCHVHCKYSYDSLQEPLWAIRQAAKLGLRGLCITEHADYDESPPELTPVDASAYRAGLDPLLRAHPGLGMGVEIALRDAGVAARTMEALGGAADWDLIIGSVHNTPNGDPYEPAFFEGRPKETAYRDYVEEIAIRMAGDAYYQVLGHVDYVAKNAPYPDRSMTYALAPDAFDAIFRRLIEEGRTLEFNTGAQKNPNEPLWGLDILKRYGEMGGEAVSLGSDAHVSERIGWRFKEAADLCRAAGLHYLARYEKGRRILDRL